MTTAKKKADQPVWVGESETAAYYRATHGSEALTEDEINYLNDMIPAKDYNRFYARFGVALGRKNLSGIINLSDGNYPLKNATPTQPAVRNNQRNTMFAIGYDWNPARLELEYLWTKSFIYGPNPVFQPPAPTMSLHAVVSDQVLMANIYYDYRGFAERAYPYLVISLGGVHHRERMALT
ncbi:MAG TPA: hypothetical protein VLH77_00195, partial [Gammaproteobacteria bacterium]|nr:hypothetical protein [Gammaproteobacteria bacterium]